MAGLRWARLTHCSKGRHLLVPPLLSSVSYAR